MSLNIRNAETEALVRKVADLTGESLTNTIKNALLERLERITGQNKTVNLADELNTIADRCGALPDHDTRSADEILGYNEYGGFDGN